MKPKNTYLLLLYFAFCIIGSACDSGSGKHGLSIVYEPETELSLQVSVSDVSAGVNDGKLFGFEGYKASMSARYAIQNVKEDGTAQAMLYLDKFNLDSIYDFNLDGKLGSQISSEVTEAIQSESRQVEMTSSLEQLITDPVGTSIIALKNKANYGEDVIQYDRNIIEYAKHLTSSLYSFPGKMNKNFKWEDELTVSLPGEDGDKIREIISLNWEVLRFSEKEVTFFANGKSRFPELQFDDDDELKLDIRRQFGINLVLDRTNNWIKRGTIDIREELGVVEIRDEDGQEIRKPVAVRNIKIRYGQEN